MASVKGPLSPHLTVYKWQITMVLSILHRATGVFLSVGLLLFSYWLLSVASGMETFQNVSTHLTPWYGKAILLAFTFSIYLHLCNGIRHLFWDGGIGFEINTSNFSGYIVALVSVLLTILSWALGGGL
ncbi:MAG: succinate dehydrogenase, cytochrome b556 subunit [Gammaproteobacteria bacterium]|nr:succinate dehydrogenase, cytochrome b556 subunit [Gammaproteobacteria bacterium]